MRTHKRLLALFMSALLVANPLGAWATDPGPIEPDKGTTEGDTITAINYPDKARVWKHVGDPDDAGEYAINIGVQGDSNFQKLQDPLNIIFVLDGSNSMYDEKKITDATGQPSNRMKVLRKALVEQGGFFDSFNVEKVDPEHNKLNFALVPFASEVLDGKTHKMKNPLYYYCAGTAGYKNTGEFLDITFPDNYVAMTNASDFINNGPAVTKINDMKKLVSSTDYYDCANTVYYGSTNLESGLNRASQELAKVTNTGKKIIVVISDGAPTVATKITDYARGQFEGPAANGDPTNKTGGYLYSGFDDTDARTVKLQGGHHWMGEYYTTPDGVEITNNGQSSVVVANSLRDQGIEFYAIGVGLEDDPKAHNTRADVIETLEGVAGSRSFHEQDNPEGRVYVADDAVALSEHLERISRHIAGTPTILNADFSDPMGDMVDFAGASADDIIITASSPDVEQAVRDNIGYNPTDRSITVNHLTLGENEWFNLEYKVKPKLGVDFPYSQKVPTNKDAKVHWTKVVDGNVVDQGDLLFPVPTIVVEPTPKATPSETTGFQGEPQESVIVLGGDPQADDTETVNFLPETPVPTGQIDPASVTLLGNDGNPTTDPVEVSDNGAVVGSYTYDPANKTITFTPVPSFKGTAPAVTIRAANKAGKTVETSYTPTVVVVTPTANPARTKGYQGEEQEAPIVFNVDDNPKAVNFNRGRDIPQGQIDPTSVELLNPEGNPVASYDVEVGGVKIGEFVLDPNKDKVYFRPEPNYTGDVAVPPARLRATDKNGTTVETTYTPEVESVTPQAFPSETSDWQGVPQSSDIIFNQKDASRKTLNFTPGATGVASAQINPATVTLLSTAGAPAAVVDVFDGATKLGSYSLNPEKTKVIFTPEPSFVGTAPSVEVQVEDNNGTPVKTTYTPTVIGVGLTPFPAKTKDFQGMTQKAPVLFNAGDTPDSGAVVFNPDQAVEPAQIDEDSVTLLDAGNNPAATVPAMKNGVQIGEFKLVRPAEGGIVVEFKPIPSFVGKVPPVSVRATNKVGMSKVTTYTPLVVGVFPDASEAQTSNWQGERQTARIVLDNTDDLADTVNFFPTVAAPTAQINPDTVELLDASGAPAAGNVDVFENGVKVGTYSLSAAKDEIIFTPEPNFVGVAPAVQIRAADKNGTYVTTRYVPTVKGVTPAATPSETEGPQGEPQTSQVVIGPDDDAKTVNFTDGAETDKAAIDPDSITLLDKTGTPTTGPVDVFKGVTKLGTYTYDPATKIITFTPVDSFVGTAPAVSIQAANKLGTTVKTTYTPTTTPVKPLASPSETTGPQGEPQTSQVVIGPDDDAKTVNFIGEGDGPKADIDPDSISLLDEDGNPTTAPVVVFDGDGTTKLGTYTYDATTKVITFTPEPNFVGTAPAVGIEAMNKLGSRVETTYTPSTTAVTPVASPSVTTGPQGEPQTSQVVFGEDADDATVNFVAGGEGPRAAIDQDSVSLLDAAGVPTTAPVDVFDGTTKLGTYTYDATTKVITFTPEPNFVGTAPAVGVQAQDMNGTIVKTTYTPSTTAVTPVASPSVTTGPQGEPQTSQVVFGEDADDATVNFVAGGEGPRAAIDQDSVSLLDAAGVPTTAPVDVFDGTTKLGTYTYDATTKVITFTPEPNFVGTAPAVGVQAQDMNGTIVKTTYTPSTTAVTPVASPSETTGPEGEPQTSKVVFGEDADDATVNFVGEGEGPRAAIDPASVTLLDAAGNPTNAPVDVFDGTTKVGSYSYDPATQEITFTPEPNFVGTAPAVSIQAANKLGKVVKTTYTPTTTPVAPVASPSVTSGPQGKPQTSRVVIGKDASDTTINFIGEGEGPRAAIDPASITLLDKDGNPTTTPVVVFDGMTKLGTYAYDPATQVITFTPEPNFVGTAPAVRVQAANKLGKLVETTYTPSTVAVVPTADPVETTGPVNTLQTAKVVFVPGNLAVPMDDASPARIVDASGNPMPGVTTVDGNQRVAVVGVGTYTVKPDGTVEFMPEPTFVGTASGIYVECQDVNGTKVFAKYTPHVLDPAAPTPDGQEDTKPGKSDPATPAKAKKAHKLPKSGDTQAPWMFLFAGFALAAAVTGLVARKKSA